MVGVYIKGGLGNQMFEYATARALSLRLKTGLQLLPHSSIPEKDRGKYTLECFNIVNQKSNTVQRLRLVEEVNERSFYPEINSLPDQVCLSGYFQSEKYFEDFADQIRSDFTLKEPMSEKSQAWAKKIQNDLFPVSLHVRRGDYMKGLAKTTFHHLSNLYYDHAVAILRENFPELSLYIFSDDLDWCRKHFSFSVPTNFVGGNENYEDIILMSLCRHHIIANSTFSWWGAWLDNRFGSLTIAPDKCFAFYDDVKKRIPDR